MSSDTATATDHPAKWSASVLAAIDLALDELPERPARVLDPFAGVGRARLAEAVGATAEVTGVELQPEWSVLRDDPATVLGDATALAEAWTGYFDAVVTSPCYGNRMADKHDARDACGDCGGSGCTEPGCTAAHPDGQEGDHRRCPTCRGLGLSWRNTYAHALRRAGGDLVEGSAAGLQWGQAYRDLHRRAINEMLRVVRPEGWLLVNMSNHVRGRQVQRVVEWWLAELLYTGCQLHSARRVPTPRNGMGANGEARVDAEHLLIVQTPSPGQGRLL